MHVNIVICNIRNCKMRISLLDIRVFITFLLIPFARILRLLSPICILSNGLFVLIFSFLGILWSLLYLILNDPKNDLGQFCSILGLC
jgi:hypothetical protein